LILLGEIRSSIGGVLLTGNAGQRRVKGVLGRIIGHYDTCRLSLPHDRRVFIRVKEAASAWDRANRSVLSDLCLETRSALLSALLLSFTQRSRGAGFRNSDRTKVQNEHE